MHTIFTPISSTIGGCLIGLSAVLLMLINGRIAGISGIVARLLFPKSRSDASQAAAFVAGLLAAPAIWIVSGGHVDQSITGNLPLAVAAGLLVGFGAAYGGGCTSGHGVCGLSRFSWRSLVATLTFMTAAIIVVFVVRHVFGALP